MDKNKPYRSQKERMSDSFPAELVKKEKLSKKQQRESDLAKIKFLEALKNDGQLKKVDLEYLQRLKHKYHMD